jgi:thiosulfate dehydrogenase
MEFKTIVQHISRLTYVITGLILLVVFAVTVMIVNPNFLTPPPEVIGDWRPKNALTDLSNSKADRQVKYGFQLVTETSKYMGPLSKNPLVRYAGNNLSCQNCHLKAGTVQGSASFVGVTNRFPQFRGRENKMGTIEERVNGCMERSMNGVVMPEQGTQMQAIVAYMQWLSEGVPSEQQAAYKGFVKVEFPEEKADLVKGKVTYELECQVCHGPNGKGIRPNPNEKYVYPPLWGNDTYNHGAGMHRVLTAAQFIKANMPFEIATWDNPKLTDEQSYHVAAYINSFDRPQKANPESDFPDKLRKPVSTPYGPWEDNFSPEQHKYGPFQPIMEFYQKEYGIKKTK